MAELRGEQVSLIPAKMEDLNDIYHWLAKSDLTSLMMGPPDYDDSPIPSYEEFIEDYHPGVFNLDTEKKEQSYLILHQQDRIGQINFDGQGHGEGIAEMDIWLKSSNYVGKGLGVEAINLLSAQLLEWGYRKIIIAPSARNTGAIRAYQKAGFNFSTDKTHYPDYQDAVTLTRKNVDQLIDKLAWIRIENRKVLGARSFGKNAFYAPGGKREYKETDEEALVREIKEELNVHLIKSSLKHFGNFQAQAHGKSAGTEVKMTCYLADYEGKLEPTSEIEEIKWLDYSDYQELPPVDQVIFDYLKLINLID